jgi:hypothetical protein
MSKSDLSSADPISSFEANYWWRQTTVEGALINKLMVLFIIVPVVLVLKNFYTLSFVVFAFMVPYGLFVRHLAVRAVRHYLHEHPEEREQFEQAGIISHGQTA